MLQNDGKPAKPDISSIACSLAVQENGTVAVVVKLSGLVLYFYGSECLFSSFKSLY